MSAEAKVKSPAVPAVVVLAALAKSVEASVPELIVNADNSRDLLRLTFAPVLPSELTNMETVLS